MSLLSHFAPRPDGRMEPWPCAALERRKQAREEPNPQRRGWITRLLNGGRNV